jgi:hypothetical protein
MSVKENKIKKSLNKLSRPSVKLKKTLKKLNLKPVKSVLKDKNLKKYKKRMRWDCIIDRLPKNRKIKGAEIGVLNGNTAHRLLKALPLLIHIMIDPWKVPDDNDSYASQPDCNARKSQREHEQAYQRTLKYTKFAGSRAKVWRMKSNEAAPNVKDGSLDFVFVDGDHSEAGTFLDLQLWWPKIKPGGWIGGHDYKHESRPDLGGVTRAWQNFFDIAEIQEDANHTCFVFKKSEV